MGSIKAGYKEVVKMRAILLSVRPEHAVYILNGDKTLELRKRVPKDFKGWVYIYVTKGKGLLINNNYSSEFYECYKMTEKEKKRFLETELVNEVLSGKVPARFWFDEFEKYYFDNHKNNYRLYTNIFPMATIDYEALCLNEKQVNEYGNEKDLYTWRINNLEIFKTPLKLDEFTIIKKRAEFTFKKKLYKGTVLKTLKEPPLNWRYVYMKGE